MLKLIVLLLLSVSYSFGAVSNTDELLHVKYWKLNPMSSSMVRRGTSDLTLFNKWIYDKSQISIVSNVYDDHLRSHAAPFWKTRCSVPISNASNRKICVFLDPTVDIGFSIKIHTYYDYENDFVSSPIMFNFSNKVGIVVFDLSDKFYNKNNLSKDPLLKHSVYSINKVIDFFAKRTALNKKDIIVIGNFGVSKNTISKKIPSKYFKISKGTQFIKYHGNYRLVDSDHVITYGNRLLKSSVDYTIMSKMKKYSTSSKKKNYKRYTSEVSDHFPINLLIDFKKRN